MKKIIICLLFFTSITIHSNYSYISPTTWTPAEQESLIQKIFIDFVTNYPDWNLTLLETRTDPQKLKSVILHCINRYGRKYARSFLVNIAHDIGLQTEPDVNQFVRDCKELMKALLPQKMMDWAHIYLIVQTQHS